MERVEIILWAGIIVAVIWLCACILIEGQRRKNVILTGVIIDLVLFLICRNCQMLLIGVLGGIICGLTGFGYSSRKYETAVREMKGVKNLVIACIIFFVMIFMTMAIAYPNLKVKLI